MSQQCDICGKKPSMGNHITTRGKAKYLGGVGTKVTGIAQAPVQAELADRPRDDRQGHQHDEEGLHPVHP